MTVLPPARAKVAFWWARDWVGRIIGVVTLTPYEFWRKTHARHHAHSGIIHHLNARIPNYRLQEAMEAVPELQSPTRIRVRDTLELIRLTLWDETETRLVRFGEARRLARKRMAA